MTATIVDVRVTLPDDWWPIPLVNDATIRESISDLIDGEVAEIVEIPEVLAGIRSALHEQATTARENGGRLLALCRHRHGDLPIPASLVLSWVDAPPNPDPPAGSPLQELRDRLQPDASAPLPVGHSLDLAQIPPGPVLRRVRTDLLDLPGTGESVDALVVDYWLERPEARGVVHLAFSSPVTAIRDAWLELWDAIVSALHWVEAEAS